MRETIRFGMDRLVMPTRCPDCKEKMSPVQYDNKHWSHFYGSAREARHYRECKCGCLIVWEFPNVFVRRHILPLFDLERDILGGDSDGMLSVYVERKREIFRKVMNRAV